MASGPLLREKSGNGGFSSKYNNNNNYKTCNAHVSTLLGVQDICLVLRSELNFVVQRQDRRLSGREFQMRGAAEEKDLSPHECRDLGSMRRSMELDRRFLDGV